MRHVPTLLSFDAPEWRRFWWRLRGRGVANKLVALEDGIFGCTCRRRDGTRTSSLLNCAILRNSGAQVHPVQFSHPLHCLAPPLFFNSLPPSKPGIVEIPQHFLSRGFLHLVRLVIWSMNHWPPSIVLHPQVPVILINRLLCDLGCVIPWCKRADIADRSVGVHLVVYCGRKPRTAKPEPQMNLQCWIQIQGFSRKNCPD